MTEILPLDLKKLLLQVQSQTKSYFENVKITYSVT